MRKTIMLANETTASSFAFSVPEKLFDVLSNMSEEDLSKAMPKQSMPSLSYDKEGNSYLQALEKLAETNGIESDTVLRQEIPTFWFDTGWSFAEKPSVPDTIDISSISFNVEDTEFDVAYKISKLLSGNFSVFGFGLRADGAIVFSVTELYDTGNVVEGSMFYLYESIGNGLFEKTSHGIDEASILKNYNWNTNPDATLPYILLSLL